MATKVGATKAHARGISVTGHFEGRESQVRAIYDSLLAAARKLGPVSEEPKKTSIHLVRKTAFAGVATRRDALWLTLKSDSDLRSSRIHRREQASASRWHLELRLQSPREVDAELKQWMEAAYELSG